MKKKVAFLLVGLFISLITTQAQNWIQIGQDIDGEYSEDYLGHSVSLSSDGSIVAIGATGDYIEGYNAGYVRVYENQSGTWMQIGQDIIGEYGGDHSGFRLDLSSDGSIVAIGTPYNDGNGLSAGHVRIFENQSETWIQIGQDIDGEAAGDQSGILSLSSDGSIVAIGAPYNNGNGSFAGHVRIFQNQSGTWTQIGQDIDGEAEEDMSGSFVSLSSDGSIVAISARYNDGKSTNAGHVRVYENQSGTWTQIGQDIDGEADEDQSGKLSLSSDGSIVAIGALYNDGNGTNAGHVRIFENQNGTWTQIGQDIDGEAAEDHSGVSVSLSSDGSIVAIGANQNYGNGAQAGHVRIYKNQSGIWTQMGQDIDGEASGDWSGCAVSLCSRGSIVAIGAILNNGNASDAGHVRVFRNPYANVSEIIINSISIYPNPSTDIVNFEFSNNNFQKLTISGIAGKKIIEKTELQQNETIDLSNFESGIFIVSIQKDNEIFTTKIIKK